MSVALLAPLLRTISGERYAGEPQKDLVRSPSPTPSLESPKSANFMWPSEPIK